MRIHQGNVTNQLQRSMVILQFTAYITGFSQLIGAGYRVKNSGLSSILCPLLVFRSRIASRENEITQTPTTSCPIPHILLNLQPTVIIPYDYSYYGTLRFFKRYRPRLKPMDVLVTTQLA